MSTAARKKSGFVSPMGLLQRVQAHGGGVQPEAPAGARKLDPQAIRPSRWANRHETSFQSAEFEALKTEIADAGGNVQPIKVRPLAGEPGRYEIVFGHRRHRACLELGLQVSAVVQDLDERALWAEMERENRGRANLSAWEQGASYRRALEAGLFPSMRMLAQAIGRDQSDVSKALRIAQLPPEVVSAFRSPNDIQYRWAADLTAALEQDAAGVMRRAADPALRDLPAREVLGRLIGEGPSLTAVKGEGRSLTTPARLDLGHGRHAEVRTDGKRVTLELDAELLQPGSWEALEKALRKALLS